MYTVFAITLFGLPFGVSAYEPVTTHAGLSQEIVAFYNATHSAQISSANKELIVKGSIEEDVPPTRAINHFYDPVRNMGFNSGRTAKEWAISTACS